MSRPPPRVWPPPDQVRIVHSEREPLWRDVYHAFLTLSWWGALGILAGGWLATNLSFALLFAMIGGVESAAPGSLWDAFQFSVQTFGTIGYGVMHPRATGAHLLVDAESMIALLLTAIATGLVLAKFTRTTARVAFSDYAAIGPMNGTPMLMIRVGNLRGNRIIDAKFRAVLFRTELLAEGHLFYRMLDLKLEREWAPALSRSLTILHKIEPGSPFHGIGPEEAKALELELVLMVTGIDETTMAPIHALTRYEDVHLAWGARHADVLTLAADGMLELDVRRFHDLVPTQPIVGFPYRWTG